MRRTKLGRRERLARKRHRRVIMTHYHDGAVLGPLKVGHRHSKRIYRLCLACITVAEAEKRIKGTPESQ